MRVKFLILLALIFSLTSCVSKDDIKFEQVASYRIKGVAIPTVKLDLDLIVSNSSNRNISIKDCEATILKGDRKIAKIVVDQKVVIGKKTERGRVTVPLKVTLAPNFITSALFGGLNSKNMSCVASAKVKAALFYRDIEYGPIPLSTLEEQYGIDIVKLLKK